MSLVWVIGGKGFLGRHVARRFACQGWRVAGLGRGEWAAEEAAEWGFGLWMAAAVSADALGELAGRVGQPEVVVNATGSGSVGEAAARPFADFTDTVAATATILEHLRGHAPGCRLVQTSSAAVYGSQPAGPIAEVVAPNPLSLYGTHKAMAEALCRSYAVHYGLSCWIVRYFSLYGPTLRKQLFWDLSWKLRNPGAEVVLAGTGAETRDFLHVDDAARLAFEVAARPAAGCHVVNGGSGVATTIAWAAALLGETLGTGATPRFSGEVRPGDPQHYQADPTLACALGFQPEWTLERGLADYVAWLGRQEDWQ